MNTIAKHCVVVVWLTVMAGVFSLVDNWDNQALQYAVLLLGILAVVLTPWVFLDKPKQP